MTETETKIFAELTKAKPSIEMYLVGGAVRDYYLSKTPKDLDYVIVGMTYNEIADALRGKFHIDEIGKSFGIVQVKVGEETIDLAVPRTEYKTGEHHTDFVVNTEDVTIEEDLSRRDFTMNAIAKNVVTGRYLDPYLGREDLAYGVIKAVGNPDERFREDPLRMFRAIQFAIRFNMTLSAETATSILNNSKSLLTVSKERFLNEIEKAIKDAESSERLNRLLESLGISKVLFQTFEPLDIKFERSDDLETRLQLLLASWFYKTGLYTNLNLTNKQASFVNTARAVFEGYDWIVHRHWKQFRGKKQYLTTLLKFFTKEQFPVENENILRLLATPLELKELDITGEEIMAIGINGRMIGLFVDAVIQSIYMGEMKNENSIILSTLEKLKNKYQTP